jgi:hypothetical protein
MSDPLHPPADAHHAIALDGEAFIWQPGPGVVVQSAAGILSLPLATCFADFYRPILRPGTHFQIFDDFTSLTHYTREARDLLTAFTIERVFAVDTIHVLFSSKYMALGIDAFKHGIGDEHVATYSDRASFLQSLTEAMGTPQTSVRAVPEDGATSNGR